MIDEAGLAKLESEISYEFSKFRLVKKSESGFMKFLNLLLVCITFGQMKRFMTDFTTTIGYTIYIPSEWETRIPAAKAVTLRHERVHMRQRRERGWFAFSFLYLFILPAFRAYYRTRFEKEAYEESLLAIAEYYGDDVMLLQRRQYIDHFTGSNYFWAWTKAKDIEIWFDDACARVLKKRVQSK